jgi:hypothetical protein
MTSPLKERVRAHPLVAFVVISYALACMGRQAEDARGCDLAAWQA